MMKWIFSICIAASCTFASAQTFVTSNKDGTPDHHAMADTTSLQPYAVSSKKFIGVGKNVDIICTPVSIIIDKNFQPVRVSSEKQPMKKQ